MALPVELRVLCHQLSTTPTSQLPQLTPILLRNALRCQEILSAETQNSKKDAPERSVLVHKLKTQISALLYGKSAEGRFTAVVLIKAIVDVGGWEILKGVESWVRGMLSLLVKPDPISSKRLCILVLTGIFVLTYQYQTLVREITTPTLPTFVTSCLNLISSNSPGRTLDSSPSLLRPVFESFSSLILWYPNIFRPFARQIRLAVRPFIAPTLCDGRFVSPSLSRTARHLAVLLHWTAAKNTGGDEWGRAVRELVLEIHLTTDRVFRAVIEDWESSTGYVIKPVDINQEIRNQEAAEGDLPEWAGIDAGIEKIVGLLGFLEEHFKHPTAYVVSIPLEVILDLLNRLTSVVPPVDGKGNLNQEGIRLNSGIERNEREALWAGLQHIHIASIEVFYILVERLQHNFAPMAEPCLSQILWLYSVPRDESFRCVMYRLIFKVLPMCGPNLQKQSVTAMIPIIRACCKDLWEADNTYQPSLKGEREKASLNISSANADTFLHNKVETSVTLARKSQTLLGAAAQLLPLFISHLPQEHLQGYLRAEIDRIAIFTRHKGAMLASVMIPFIRKDGKCFPSILPHLCREFSDDPAVESLLRPRFPVLQQIQPSSEEEDEMIDEAKNKSEGMMEGLDVIDAGLVPVVTEQDLKSTIAKQMLAADEQGALDPQVKAFPNYWGPETATRESMVDGLEEKISTAAYEPSPLPSNMAHGYEAAQNRSPVAIEEDDSDESVHLAMELSESDAESLS